MRITRLSAILLTLAVFALLAPAADKPNFSGDWKLDVMKSNLGPMPPPDSWTRKIEHTDPELKVSEEQKGAMGDRNSVFKYTTDGKEVVNSVQGMDAKSVTTWDGANLSITTKLDAGGTEVKLTEKWTLSGDGKTLTSALKIVSPQGEFELSVVMVKQ